MIDALFDRVGRAVSRATALFVLLVLCLVVALSSSSGAWHDNEPVWVLVVLGAALVATPLSTALGVLHGLYVATLATEPQRRRLAWLEASAQLGWPRLLLAVVSVRWPPIAVLWIAAEGAPLSLAVLRLAQRDDSEQAALALGAPARLAAMTALWLRIRTRLFELACLAFAQIFGALMAVPLLLQLLEQPTQLVVPPGHLFLALAGTLVPRVVASALVREVGL